MTEDPEDRGYRSTRLWGQWQLQSVSISNGDGRWPICSPGVRGQGTSMQQHRNKQKAKASSSGAERQPRHKAARMRRSKSGLSVVRVPPPPWRRPVPVTPRNPLSIAGQHLPQWSHPLSLAGRSASMRAWNAAYVCGPCLTRSDTVSTRRRARRRKAGNSAGLAGTDSDI